MCHTIASGTISQAVFETYGQDMSLSDLEQFQSTFGIPQQEASFINSNSNPACTNENCAEGNLDIQYLMAIAQKAKCKSVIGMLNKL